MEQIFLNELLDYDYQFAETKEDKDKIIKTITKYIFRSDSKVSYRKYHLSLGYILQERHLGFREDLIELFKAYNNIQYVKLKKVYDVKTLEGLDFIKIKLQNLYGFYCDKEVIDTQEYHRLIATAKREYFDVVKRTPLIRSLGISRSEYNERADLETNNMENVKYDEYIDNQIRMNIELVNSSEIKARIETALARAEEIKQQVIKDKVEMSWVEFKNLAISFFPQILDTYDSDWMEDDSYEEFDGNSYKYVSHIKEPAVGYINKRLEGLIYNHFNYKIKNMKRCRKNREFKLFALDGIKEKYHPLQLCISKFYESEEELLSIDVNASLDKLTNKQREFIHRLTDIIKDNAEKDLFLFNSNGLPFLNESFIASKTNVNQSSISRIFRRINGKMKKA